jgi:ribosomal peptide maturation radical SAM protein 1
VAKPSVLLVAMPWHWISSPSIQIGLLHGVLEDAGIRAATATLSLAFMEHCRAATADRPEAERIGLAAYDAVATEYDGVGLGDWIFAGPPFRDAPGTDAAYLAFLRERGVPERAIGLAQAMRRLVPGFLERAADEVLASGARVVGFTSTFGQNVPSLALARLLKRRDPALAVVFGGANCDGPMGAALHRTFPWVDVVVRGEAEAVLPGVVRDLVAGGPVRPRPGLCYRGEDGRSVAVPEGQGGPVDLDASPLPRYDEFFDRLAKTGYAAELAPAVALVYESARGCWWGAKSHCTFCGLNGLGMAYRSKSPDRVLADLTALARRHGRLDFQIVDNILDHRYFDALLPRLRDAGHDLNIFYELKANVRREQVRLLRDAGVNRIQPGLESLSTPILELMRKGVTALQNVRLLKWGAEYGLRVYWNVIYGFPGEPADEYARMAALVPSLVHLQPPSLCRLVINRFSPYHERPAEFGLEATGPRAWYRHVYDADAATLTDLAYTFEYRHLDGRDPEAYVGAFREAVDAWREAWPAGFRSLRYRRGPGVLVVVDRRPGLEPADYVFEAAEARIHLACEDGATAAEALAALRADGITDLDVDDVRSFLDELVERRLVFAENGRYLALALPSALPEAV